MIRRSIAIALGVTFGCFAPGEAHADPEGPGPLVFELGADDPVRVRLGASVWGRGHVRDEATRTAGIVQRTRAEMQMRWRFLGTFVQLGDVRRWGQAGPLAPFPPGFGLHQGYASIGGRSGDFAGSLRVGRLQHTVGSGWLISNRPFNPNEQAFDAASLRMRWRMLSLDLFGAMTAAPATYEHVIEGETVSLRSPGDFLTSALVEAAIHPTAIVEASVVTHSQSITATDPVRSRLVVAPSLRIRGSAWDRLSWEAEGFFQAGRWDGQPHRAWAARADVGYGRRAGDVRPQANVGYVIASGDRCTRDNAPDNYGLCADGVHRAFSPMFGYRHRYLGFTDLFEFSNVSDLYVSTQVDIERQMKFRVDYHWLALQEGTGSWTRITGAQVVPSPAAAADRGTNTMGHEVDLVMTLVPWSPLSIDLAYAPFFVAGLGRDVIPERVRHFAWLQMQLKF